jgi:hypothetical protein
LRQSELDAFDIWIRFLMRPIACCCFFECWISLTMYNVIVNITRIGMMYAIKSENGNKTIFSKINLEKFDLNFDTLYDDENRIESEQTLPALIVKARYEIDAWYPQHGRHYPQAAYCDLRIGNQEFVFEVLR